VIEVKHLYKKFGALQALDDINLTVNDGDIVCLIGPSGSGKSTLCRCIHGLETADEGEVWLDGELMDPSNKNKYTAQRKKMGFVFQHFNLFNNKTVLGELHPGPDQFWNFQGTG
jgi:ABC-type polar amino acid transport system ATPase subunit